SREVRERATLSLNKGYPLYKDLVQAKMEDRSISADTKAALGQISAAWSDLPLAEQTMTALDLANDPVYVVSLLDAMDARELAIVGGRLEKLTGQNFGSDAAKWKAWAHEAASQDDAARTD